MRYDSAEIGNAMSEILNDDRGSFKMRWNIWPGAEGWRLALRPISRRERS
jgi:hypothetical protein